VNKNILRLAIPNIISNLSVPLLSSVDTALMGHMDQIYYLGAVAVGGMIFNFVYWGFGFLRMGTTGLTAQAFGNEDPKEAISILGRALLVAISAGLLMIILKDVIEYLSFLIIPSTGNVETHARLYFGIRIFAAPATLAMYAFTGWFFGMQNATIPLLITILTNGLNIGFNLLFIKKFGMKADGVALGTVCANYIGVLFTVWLFAKKYRVLFNQFKIKRILDWQKLKKFFQLNLDIFIRTLCLIFVFSFFTAKSSANGETILAVNSILINLWTILAYGIDGFAFAAESLVGRFVGAKDKTNFIKAVRLSFIWGIGLGVLISLFYWIFAESILRIFTDNSGLIVLAMGFMIWTIMAPIVNGFCYIWDGIFIGATATKAMRTSMLICTFLIFLPVYYLTIPYFGNHGLWLALIVFMIARGITLSFYFKNHILVRI
jgi:multidrug resistance protein, MATE family